MYRDHLLLPIFIKHCVDPVKVLGLSLPPEVLEDCQHSGTRVLGEDPPLPFEECSSKSSSEALNKVPVENVQLCFLCKHSVTQRVRGPVLKFFAGIKTYTIDVLQTSENHSFVTEVKS